MAGIFTVFNSGTGHEINELDNSIGHMSRVCLGSKHTNDGPLGTGGLLWGQGMPAGVSKTVAAIDEARPHTVNLVGHSRGAVLIHMIVNELARLRVKSDPAASEINCVNILMLDPVNQTFFGKDATQLLPYISIGDYVWILMQNVKHKWVYKRTSEPVIGQAHRKRAYELPGTHGAGQQAASSAIGDACLGMMKQIMADWGTEFASVPTAEELCVSFACIHIENPPQDSGSWLSRLQRSFGKKEAVAAPSARFEGIFGPGHGDEFLDSPYFFNQMHLDNFMRAYPATYSAMLDPSLASESGVDVELEIMHPAVKKSLEILGML